jgi:ornithine carbamoyltransferase
MKTNASDLLRDLDLTDDALLHLLDLAAEVKQSPREYARALDGKSIALLFEKPSLRTRLTFELAIKQLGGDALFVDGPIGVREPLKDVARNLDRWVDGIVARVFKQATVEGLAEWSSVPVINALSDLYHPCQALGDAQTLRERFGELKGRKVAFIGDGNNVAHSLMLTSLRLGADFAIGCPEGYTPDPDIVAQAEGLAAVSGASLLITHSPALTPSTRMCGPAWARSRNCSSGRNPSTRSRWTTNCSRRRGPTPYLCTAFPPSAVKRSRIPLWSTGAPQFSIRPRTGCTRRRRCC